MTAAEVSEGQKAIEGARVWLAHEGPCPTAEEVVGPFVRAMLALHDLGERADELAYPASCRSAPDMEEEARTLVATVRRATELAVVAARSCTPPNIGKMGEVAAAVRLLFETLTRIADHEQSIDSAAVERLSEAS